jgi:hypothetical protein
MCKICTLAILISQSNFRKWTTALIKKAHDEYAIYKEKIKNRITQVEKDFIKQIEKSTKRLKDTQQKIYTQTK